MRPIVILLTVAGLELSGQFMHARCYPGVLEEFVAQQKPDAPDSVAAGDKALYFFLINQLAVSYQSFVSDARAWIVSADIAGSVLSETHAARFLRHLDYNNMGSGRSSDRWT